MQSGILHINKGEKMKFVNLTPHALGICDPEGKLIASIPSVGSARVKTSATEVAKVEIEGTEVSVVETSYGEVEGLPEPIEGTMYIVSILVVSALKALGIDRSDVVAPDTGPASVVRDEGGNIVGVKRFTR